MKSLQELEKIRKSTLDTMNLRKEAEGTRIVVGMATCGIAAGARPVLLKIMEEVQKRNLTDVTVAQTGVSAFASSNPSLRCTSRARKRSHT